jgi:hypothetical protein
MCRGAGKSTRETLKALIAHDQWLQTLPDPAVPLAKISESKVAQWANEAQRLKARELREYVAPRRYALLLAAFRSARGRLLDELTAMLIKFSAKIVWRSEERREEARIDRGDQSATLIATLAEFLTVISAKTPPADKLGQLDTILTARGGCEVLQKACEEYFNHSPNRWQPFAYQAFSPYRTELSVREAEELNTQVSLMRSVRLDAKHRRPVLPRISRLDLPVSVVEAARRLHPPHDRKQAIATPANLPKPSKRAPSM